jgi:hypothetical protein
MICFCTLSSWLHQFLGVLGPQILHPYNIIGISNVWKPVRNSKTGTVRPGNAPGRTVRRFLIWKCRTVRPTTFPGRTGPVRPAFRASLR